jgi:SPP1 gp7 family putative phage head morphogenesis protein
VGEELTKLEIGNISKLITAVYITDTDFRKILLKSVMGAFKTSHQNTNVQYGFGGTKPDQHAIDYLQERVFILSDKTTSKLEGDLRFELLEGLKNNESISAITKRLDGIFSDMMPWQLERISRTEILNAQNAGRMSAYEKSGVVKYKMWQAAINNARTAADSKRLHGQIQPLDKPFVDPKTGDTFMHPPNRPQCRCTLIPLRKLPDDVITTGGLLYAADKKMGKIEIPTDLLKSRQKRKAWVVRYANGYAVQCFEDEADADYFIETSKEKDAGWFDFNNKVYREVKPGWVINKKGTKITFKTMSESERKAFDEKLLNEDKRVNKIEIQISQLEKFSKTGLVRKKVPVTRKGKKTMEYRWVRAEERVKVHETGMARENLVSIKTGLDCGIGGTMHESGIRICDFKDGSRGIYKLMEPIDIDGEITYYAANKILNWDTCPETIKTDLGIGVGSCQKWIPYADSPYTVYNLSGIKIEEKHFNDLSMIFVQDMLCGNKDRNEYNIVMKDDKVYAIDNESSMKVIGSEHIDALDTAASLSFKGGYAPMLNWMKDSLSIKDFEIFRNYVIKNMKYAIKYKDQISKLYGDNYKTILRNFESLEHYIKENE